jgi:hypothetical protein
LFVVGVGRIVVGKFVVDKMIEVYKIVLDKIVLDKIEVGKSALGQSEVGRTVAGRADFHNHSSVHYLEMFDDSLVCNPVYYLLRIDFVWVFQMAIVWSPETSKHWI